MNSRYAASELDDVGAAVGDEVGAAVGDDAGVSTMLGSVVTGTPSAFVALAAEPSSSSSFASAASAEEPSTATVAEITDEPSELLLTASVTLATSTPAALAICSLIVCSLVSSGVTELVKVMSTVAGGGGGAAVGAEVGAAVGGDAGVSTTLDTFVIGTPRVSDAFAAEPSPLSRLSSTASAEEPSTATVAVMTEEPSELVLTASVTLAASTPASLAMAFFMSWSSASSGCSGVVKVIATDEAAAAGGGGGGKTTGTYVSSILLTTGTAHAWAGMCLESVRTVEEFDSSASTFGMASSKPASDVPKDILIPAL